MTHETRGKVSFWTKIGGVAAILSVAAFFGGKASEAGEYKQKVNGLETWRVEHQQVAEKRIGEIEDLKVAVAKNEAAFEEIKGQLSDIKSELRRRNREQYTR